MIKAKIIVMSHLSDMQEEAYISPERIVLRANFIKWLILNLNGDLNHLIDPDEKFKQFEVNN